MSSESPDKFSEASIPPRGHTKHLADEILSARENFGSSEEIHSEKRGKSRRHKKSLPPLDKKRDKSDKNRKKAKSWPDRDPGEERGADDKITGQMDRYSTLCSLLKHWIFSFILKLNFSSQEDYFKLKLATNIHPSCNWLRGGGGGGEAVIKFRGIRQCLVIFCKLNMCS